MYTYAYRISCNMCFQQEEMAVNEAYEEETDVLPVMNTQHQSLRKVVSDVTNEINKLGKDLETIVELDETIIQADCECCGLKEDCTKEYISRIRISFSGKWVCGLCSEAVMERVNHGPVAIEEAVITHKNFVEEFRVNPKLSLTWAMKDIAKRSGEKRKNGGKKIMRSSSCVPRIDFNINK